MCHSDSKSRPGTNTPDPSASSTTRYAAARLDVPCHTDLPATCDRPSTLHTGTGMTTSINTCSTGSYRNRNQCLGSFLSERHVAIIVQLGEIGIGCCAFAALICLFSSSTCAPPRVRMDNKCLPHRDILARKRAQAVFHQRIARSEEHTSELQSQR